ncbi:molecular chaperone [Pseudoalteromonas sp. MMG010]|uniref:fimbrial biogenesis chaperone n=1 Tax=Pseudoalteromonas sp. MMG010 TaxID=2822685 RepID=UPI001B3A2885|nr:fimbria/pilus periplasmic chaperone [Pseudoalteromonas sp. MMG010]MBQ4831898.1 molecular chaperone [Pseudoalteromonas sp. MMG010]
MKRYFFTFFLFFQIIFSAFSYANLLISPTRVAFDERQRVEKIILINDSKQHQTYRLQWQEKIAKPEGGFYTLDDTMTNPKALSSMIRVSPSQVSLAPGERQIVKLALRKPKGLVAQEYRSHLLFRALPNDTSSSKELNAGVNVNFILSYSIPIILRQGKLERPKVGIEDIKLVKAETNDVSSIRLTMSQTGQYSSFGSIEAFYTANNTSTETKVAILNGFSIFPEIDKKIANVSLLEKGLLNLPGKLRVIYKGADNYKNHIFAEKQFLINANGSVSSLGN